MKAEKENWAQLLND